MEKVVQGSRGHVGLVSIPGSYRILGPVAVPTDIASCAVNFAVGLSHCCMPS